MNRFAESPKLSLGERARILGVRGGQGWAELVNREQGRYTVIPASTFGRWYSRRGYSAPTEPFSPNK